MKKIFSPFNYLLTFTQQQLAITFFSLPILVSWGLDFSIMAIIGNLIFAPALIIFLVLSSLLLFTELLCIPNTLIAKALNVICTLWHYLLSFGSPEWTFALAKPSKAVLFIFPLLAWFVLCNQRINTSLKRIFALLTLIFFFISTCALQKYLLDINSTTRRFNKHLYSIKLDKKNEIIIIDKGYFSRKKSVEKAINYDLKQWITKQHGSVTIAELRLTSPSMASFKACEHMCALWHVNTVWVPYFTKSLSKNAWHHYFKLKDFLIKNNIRFVRYHQ